jgi:methylaspartate ammonia-lyase
MSSFIRSIVTQPGLGVVPGQTILSVGLVLDDGFVAWGECVAEPSEQFDVQAAIRCIDDVVRPFFLNQPLTTFRDVADKLNNLTEIVTLTEATYPLPSQPPGPSRREILRGQFTAVPAPPQPIVQQREVERPLLAPIRYGLSQALWQAIAHVQQKTLLAVLVEEYGLMTSSTAVPLHVEINPHTPLSIASITQNPIASIGYSISGINPVIELGQNGEVLQRFVRQLKEQLVGTADPQSFAFHLNVRGGYGQLHDQQLGRILGTLVGLESAAGPFLVRVEDPFLVNGHDEQIKKMALLKSYMATRRMKLQLVAHQGIQSAADAQAFLAGKAAHMLHLDLPQLGSIGEGITAVQACQQNEVGTLWGGSPEETEIAARLSVQAALALQPTLLLVKFGRLGSAAVSLVHNEMIRALAAGLRPN